jgi:beta-glucosidase
MKIKFFHAVMKTALIVPIFAGSLLMTGCVSNAPKEESKAVQDIVSKMTLDQKAELVIGTGMHFELPDSIKKKMPNGGDLFGGSKVKMDSVYEASTKDLHKLVPGAAGVTCVFPELGITPMVLCDGPAGLRIQPQRKDDTQTYYCTAFPIATLLASSWDTALVNEVGQAMGNEVLEYGADVLLAPAMNIQRDPLCGRNFEYYSEDPLIAGKMAAAMISGIQSEGVGTSVKHFAANNQETNRLSVNEIISERALREIYLKGFQIAIQEGKPWTVMSSYNKINGTYTSESHDLLTNILRDDWGYKGFVMTDWGGGSDVVAQMKAGNDLIMPGQPGQIKEIIQAVNDGKLDEKVLDVNVSRILNIMLESPHHKNFKYTNKPDLKAHAEITRRAAAEGMVLLKNSSEALPMAQGDKNIAVFGNTSYDFISGGTGSGDVNEAYTISLIDGLKNAGYVTDAGLQETYVKYMAEEHKKQPKPENFLAALMRGKIPLAEMNVDLKLAAQMAQKSDIALITIGRNSGEGQDRKAEPGDFYLNDTEKAMIKNVTEAFHAKGKKSIVILNTGGVVETASWRDIPDAILLAWQPGQEAGNSVADVISGKVNPSGKLAVSFPMSYSDVPSAKNFPGTEIKVEGQDQKPDVSGFSFMRRVPWQVTYEEDIYVGYRYYSTFKVPVAYEFGYGLSYSTFEISNLKLGSKEFAGQLTVTVDVKNTGKVAGREVAQVYLSAPAKKLNKPEEELVAFGKTKMLNPGESETLTFTLKPQDLSSFDEAASSWVADAGSYQVKVGNSSANIEQTDSFDLANDLVVGKVSKSLVPQVEINRLVRE